MKHLVLGGIRSGKSRYAERLAHAHGGPVTVIATGTAGDAEMRARIAAHRARRPPPWATVEEPSRLAAALHAAARPGGIVLVECLTLWLTNLLGGATSDADAEIAALEATLPALPGDVVLVGNEVGLGIIPLGELTRRFVDLAGALHQNLARTCDSVVLLVAGLPLTVKEPSS